MHLPEEAPPLNPWPFLAGDAALIATAYRIGSQASAPLNGLPLIAVASCVGLGAILAVIPFLLNHTRRQELALTDRQREIAALAQTTATSAEQISIAAASLHSIAENAARAAKLAELLPHKVQEKINDFKSQLNEVAVTENESLAQEINTLRASETERLETALAGVRKTAADLAMIEAVTRKHLSELSESLARFTVSTEKAAGETAKAIETARSASEKSLATAQASATGAIKDTVSSALAEIDRKIAALTGLLAQNRAEPAPSAPATTNTGDEPAHEPPAIASITQQPPAPPEEKPVPPPAAASARTEPVATAFTDLTDDSPASAASETKPARKRLPRKTAGAETEPTLGIETAEDLAQSSPDDSTPAVSADGLTRLLVTAYIGIGNKLYVRGEGPGLAWDRGIPLQFVSIGKWRWETADASAPVKLKLYKNDEFECTSLGTVAVLPGHQQEVTASFS